MDWYRNIVLESITVDFLDAVRKFEKEENHQINENTKNTITDLFKKFANENKKYSFYKYEDSEYVVSANQYRYKLTYFNIRKKGFWERNCGRTRIRQNWKDRKVEIFVPGILTVGALAASGILMISGSFIAAMSFSAFALATLGLSLTSALRTPKKWQESLPFRKIPFGNRLVLPIIEMGVLCFSEFQIGALVGTLQFICLNAMATTIDKIFHKFKEKYDHFPKDHKPKTFEEYRLNFFGRAIEGPIREEIVFREILQPYLSQRMGSTWGTLGTAFYFGYVHKDNPTTPYGKVIQCMACGIGGLVYGHLKNQYGLTAAIAAHMVHNVLVDRQFLFEPWDEENALKSKFQRFLLQTQPEVNRP